MVGTDLSTLLYKRDEPIPLSIVPRIVSAVNVSIRPLYGEKYLRRLLWYLLGGTRGGPTRAEIIKILIDRPSNPNQLAELLEVDYKTVQHHIRVLEENGLIVPSEKGAYGAVFFLTPKMEEAMPIFNEIWSKIGRRMISASEAKKRE